MNLYQRSIAIRANIPETHNNLSAALRLAGRPSDAEAAAQQALRLDRNYGEAENNLGLALCDLKRYPEAIHCFECAIQIDRENVEALNNLGVALDAAGKVDKARETFVQALALQPENIDAKLNLGNLYRKTGQLTDAAQQYSEALELNPGDLRAYANLGLTLINKNQPEGAIALYEKALALAPETPDIQMSLGIAQLMLGDFEDGWRNYEARWQAISFTAKRRSFAGTPWTGQPLTGKSILVYAEQGFGDTIQFARYLPLIAEQADKVVFECQKALMQLCSNLDGVTQLVARGEPLPETDYHVPLMSLPHRMAETVGHVPIVTRYLRPACAAAESFRQRLQTGKPSVG
ncbi:MAG: tetratricopeptide repeat protein, partial [Pseudomonadota bacterium]|nr:tetratricopeptide repeat protein [Pseudomonadota bacterium]